MIVILGASGFIGSYLIEELLSHNEKVIGTYFGNKPNYSYPNLEFIQLDISKQEDYDKLPQKDVSAVIMFAGRLPANVKMSTPYDDSKEYVNTNIIGTLNALEYCRKNKVKTFLYTTSYSDVLKHAREGVPIKADASKMLNYTGDHSAYIISKVCAVDYALHYMAEYGLQSIIFRLPPVYGVGPHGIIYVDGKVYKSGIQTFIDKARKGEDIELWGDKNLYRDIVYVKDVAKACYQAINSPKAKGIYNISNGEKLYLYEQIKTIIELFSENKKSNIILRPEKENNSPSYVLDISKSIQDFGFAPQYKDFKKMMLDYKSELKEGFYNSLFGNRRKD